MAQNEHASCKFCWKVIRFHKTCCLMICINFSSCNFYNFYFYIFSDLRKLKKLNCMTYDELGRIRKLYKYLRPQTCMVKYARWQMSIMMFVCIVLYTLNLLKHIHCHIFRSQHMSVVQNIGALRYLISGMYLAMY